ncbi:MAG TPA: DNA repair protein RadA [Clostridiaceae bacterium]|nr:DNA repair protein RadA [Clostridiaceae bacterium]
MAKVKKVYVCSECGHETSGWLGRCPSCEAWNSFSVVKEMPAKSSTVHAGSWLPSTSDGARTEVIDLSKIEVEEIRRLPTTIAELDRVLGGGIDPGSLILLGGDPGIGKSTLALEILGHIPEDEILYVSGEESETQIRMRCERLELGDKAIPLLTTTNFSIVEKIILELRPTFAVIDSIQTVYSDDLTAAPGSVSQVREAGMGFLRIAKSYGITILMTGHVTKEGAIAGPRVLEHMVDTVLYFEGERDSSLRILRCVKNRFFATDEIGIFEMTEKGLVSVDQATCLFLDGKPRNTPGSVITAILEGSRPLLLELQALTVASNYGSPIRMAQGIDRSRLIMLLAVAEKKTNLDFSTLDAYVNVTGGMRIRGTSADLAILAALLSSVRNEPLGLEAIVIGEVGLTGEVRSVSRISDYLEEAYRAGWKRFVVPASTRSRLRRFEKERDVRVYYVSELNEAFDLLFVKKG